MDLTKFSSGMDVNLNALNIHNIFKDTLNLLTEEWNVEYCVYASRRRRCGNNVTEQTNNIPDNFPFKILVILYNLTDNSKRKQNVTCVKTAGDYIHVYYSCVSYDIYLYKHKHLHIENSFYQILSLFPSVIPSKAFESILHKHNHSKLTQHDISLVLLAKS